MKQPRVDWASAPAHWTPAIRIDVGRLRKAERTPAGGVRVPGVPGRAGILTYRLDDGSERRELLLPEELQRADSLATLRDAPVTVGHPDGGTRLVTPETFRQDAVGHVSGDARIEREEIVVELAIQDGSAIRRIDEGDLVELSAGYRVLLEPKAGVWRGERFDAVQRRREYNHVALLPRGGARAGSGAALRLDGRDRLPSAQTLEQHGERLRSKRCARAEQWLALRRR